MTNEPKYLLVLDRKMFEPHPKKSTCYVGVFTVCFLRPNRFIVSQSVSSKTHGTVWEPEQHMLGLGQLGVRLTFP